MATATARRPARPGPKKLKGPIRRTPLRAAAFLALGILATVVMLAAAIGLYISRSAYEAGHQSSPTEAANAFLDAALNNRDVASADKYLCSNQAIHTKINGIIGGINDFSTDGSSISYRWDTPTLRSRHDDHATVTTTLYADTTDSGDGGTDNPPQTLTMGMQDQGGWKLCSFTTH